MAPNSAGKLVGATGIEPSANAEEESGMITNSTSHHEITRIAYSAWRGVRRHEEPMAPEWHDLPDSVRASYLSVVTFSLSVGAGRIGDIVRQEPALERDTALKESGTEGV